MTVRRLLIQVPLYTVLVAALAATLTPLVWLAAATVKNSDDFFHYLFFPPPQRLSAENFQKLFGSPALATGEVRDWPALCRKLADDGPAGRPGPASCVWERLSPDAREKAAAVAGAGRLTPAEEHMLTDAFNDVLRRPDLFRQADLEGLPLSQYARSLADRLGTDLAADEAHRLNRAAFELVAPNTVRQVGRGIPFGRYMMNSLFVAGASVLIQMFFSSLGGFALAKYFFRAKKLIMTVMLATMMIPGQVMLAPLYELIFKMGFMDSYLGLIVPGMVSVFGMFLFRQSMLQIPDELLEAGRMDGCTEFGVYWHIALPVSRPMIGAFCLVAFMGNWNSFLWPQIVLHTSDLFTIPIGLNQMVGTYSQEYGIMMAGTLLAILPVMILFFILQREFISGLTAGAVKG
jgi:ABC-type glycerol-3-phosphate transport system permease component